MELFENLSQNEFKVYRIIDELGQSTFSNIFEKSNMDRKEASQILKKLEKGNYTTCTNGIYKLKDPNHPLILEMDNEELKQIYHKNY